MRTLSIRLALAAGAFVSLTACSQSDLLLSPDFGDAVRADVAGQIADPDAHYAGIPAPGSNGARVGLAQTRYEKNDVVQPATTTASGAGSIGNAENGAQPASAGAGGTGGGAGVGAGGSGP